MTLYEILKSNGKRSRYRTLELAKAAFSENDEAIYEIEITAARTMSLCDFGKSATSSEKIVYPQNPCKVRK